MQGEGLQLEAVAPGLRVGRGLKLPGRHHTAYGLPHCARPTGRARIETTSGIPRVYTWRMLRPTYGSGEDWNTGIHWRRAEREFVKTPPVPLLDPANQRSVNEKNSMVVWSRRKAEQSQQEADISLN